MAPEIFSGGVAWARSGDKWGQIDKSGAFVVAPQFEQPFYYSEGLAAVVSGGKTHFIDQTGQRAFATEYDEAGSFKDGLAAAPRRRQMGFHRQNRAVRHRAAVGERRLV